MTARDDWSGQGSEPRQSSKLWRLTGRVPRPTNEQFVLYLDLLIPLSFPPSTTTTTSSSTPVFRIRLGTTPCPRRLHRPFHTPSRPLQARGIFVRQRLVLRHHDPTLPTGTSHPSRPSVLSSLGTSPARNIHKQTRQEKRNRESKEETDATNNSFLFFLTSLLATLTWVGRPRQLIVPLHPDAGPA